jgi:hypothetical protein
MKKLLWHNGLSIVFLFLFLLSIMGQVYTGHKEHNKELIKEQQTAIPLSQYIVSGHFIETTFENWESEFLQMALFVVVTIFLRQKGSSESKKCEGKEEVDRQPSARRKQVPWPVKKGGWVLAIYKHSLTIALVVLFLLSFLLHLHGSLKDENEQLLTEGKPLQTWQQYISSSRLWFESFQNWQSEFLSIFAIIVLSIYLRQIGSPQSKPVDAPHSETGE